MLLSCNFRNDRNCLILDACVGHATVPTVRRFPPVGYLLLTVISFWIFISATAILVMPFGYLFLRVGYLFLRKPYPRYLYFPCCISAYKEKWTNAVSCLWAFSMLECLGATLAHVRVSLYHFSPLDRGDITNKLDKQLVLAFRSMRVT